MTVRLFLQIMSIEARRRMSYRVDFWLSATVGVVATFGLAWFLWRAIYDGSATGVIGGFSFDAMLWYYVIVSLLSKVVRGYALDVQVSHDIYEGELTRYLVFPTRYLPFKYAQHLGTLAPVAVQFLLFALLFGFLIGIPSDVDMTLPRVLAAGASVLIANLLYFQLGLPLQTVSFWADNVWSLSVALRMSTSLLGGAMVPIALFPTWAQEALYWTPFPLLFDAPARLMLGKLAWGDWLHLLGVTATWMVALALITRWVWQRGRLRYTGVGI